MDVLRNLIIDLSRNLLDSYQFISKFHGIPLNEVSTQIKNYSDGQRGHGQASVKCSGGDRNVLVNSTTLPQQVSNQVGRQRGHGQATAQCSRGDRNVSVHSKVEPTTKFSLGSFWQGLLGETTSIPGLGLENGINVAIDQVIY